MVTQQSSPADSFDIVLLDFKSDSDQVDAFFKLSMPDLLPAIRAALPDVIPNGLRAKLEPTGMFFQSSQTVSLTIGIGPTIKDQYLPAAQIVAGLDSKDIIIQTFDHNKVSGRKMIFNKGLPTERLMAAMDFLRAELSSSVVNFGKTKAFQAAPSPR